MTREKWSREIILEKCRKLYKKFRVIPSKSWLTKMGHAKLAQSVPRYFKNFQNLHAALGLPNERKSPDYWTLENTLSAIKYFFRTHQALIEQTSFTNAIKVTKNHALQNAIIRHKGIRELNKNHQLNIPVEENMLTEVQIIEALIKIDKAGHVITRASLKKMGESRLLRAITTLGKLTEFKKAANIAVTEPRGWNDAKILQELKPIVEEYGFFPTVTLLKAIGRKDLIKAISERGGFVTFVQKMKMVPTKLFLAKDKHYLQSSYECIFDNILFKYRVPHRVHVRISLKHQYRCDFLIGETYIEIAGYHRSNSNAYELRLEKKKRLYKKLKMNFIIIEAKVFKQRLEKIEMEVLEIISKIEFTQYLSTVSCRDICIKPATYWADFANIKKELGPSILKYGRMPTIKELYKDNKVSLVKAIYQYHGTTYDVAKRLMVTSRQVSQDYYTEEKTIQDYRELCLIHGKALTKKELYALNHRGLAHAIIKFDGFKAVRSRCEFEHPLRRVRPREYGGDEIIAGYREVCKKMGRFLSRRELIENGYTRLAGGLNRHEISLEMARKQSGLDFMPPYPSRNRYSLSDIVQAYKEQCIAHGYFLTRNQAITVLPKQMISYISNSSSYGELRTLTKLRF